MSRLEPDEDLRERYAAMEDRLSVSSLNKKTHTQDETLSYKACHSDAQFCIILLQVVRKRLNRPMTLAEKVCRYILRP